MNTTIFELESDDFEEMEQALGGWDHCYRQMSPGKFHGSLLHTQTGSLGIFRNRWERSIRYQGTPPKGTLAFAITLAQNKDARWMGQRMTSDDVIMQRAGGEAEYLSAPFWDSVVYAIPTAELTQQIADLTREDPEEISRYHGVLHLTPQVAEELRRMSLAFLKTAASTQGKTAEPSLLPGMAGFAVETVAQALVSSRRPGQSGRSFLRRRRLVRKADEYCESGAGTPLHVGKLCRELGVSERTLRNAFLETIGMSPLAYLKTQRLNRVHRLLRDADREEVMVKQAAYENGFFHLGQFSLDYKNLFAELPSETLHHGRPQRVTLSEVIVRP
jgi:AraC family ethanolamine operon transcriptional activator